MKKGNKHFKQFVMNNFLLLLVPLIVMLIFSNLYGMKIVNNKIKTSYTGTLEVYMKQYDQSLSSGSRYLVNLITTLNDKYPFKVNESEISKVKRQNEILNTLEQGNAVYLNLDYIFTYNLEKGERIGVFKDNLSNNQKLALEDWLMNTISTNQDSDSYITGWTLMKLGEKSYLHMILHLNNYIVGAFVDTDHLLAELRTSEFGSEKILRIENAEIAGTTEDTNKLKDINATDDTYIADISKNPSNIGSDRSIFGKIIGRQNQYMVEYPSVYESFVLRMFMNRSAFWEGLDILFSTIVVLSVISLLLIPFEIKRLDMKVLVPIRKVTEAMTRVETGDLYTQLETDSDLIEFQLIDKTFNSMTGRIESLMEEVVNEQLSKQDAILKYLELQINPHFYMNALNMIHSMAKMEEYLMVEEMTQYLVNHFRYILSSRERLVTVREELDFVINYLSIQELRYDEEFNFNLDINPELNDYRIPPIVIQTFVENSIKYALKMNGHVLINIKVMHDESDYMKIIIDDTGEGYPDFILQNYIKDESLTDERGEHFGIKNVMNRLKIIYGDASDLLLENRTEGGARATIRIPFYDDNGGIRS